MPTQTPKGGDDVSLPPRQLSTDAVERESVTGMQLDLAGTVTSSGDVSIMHRTFSSFARFLLPAGCALGLTTGLIGQTAAAAAATPEPASGGVFNFGAAAQYGWTGINRLGASPIVAMASTRDGRGYWEADARGAVYSFGDAGFSGSMRRNESGSPVVAMAADPNGGGYWLVTRDGGVFSFGAARFHGSLGNKSVNAPVVGIAATSNGGGYWLASADGGVFSFGNARFHGSLAGTHLNTPVVGIAATTGGGGYWLAASDGGVFSFGNARFHGSAVASHLPSPVSGIAASPTGDGYWLVSRTGGIYSYGGARFFGSVGATALATPVVGMAERAGGTGYWVVTSTTSPTLCQPNQLNLVLQGTVQAGNAHGQVWALQNASSGTCDLVGYPDVVATAANGQGSVTASHQAGQGEFYADVPRRDAVLLPGQSAEFWTEEPGTKTGNCVDATAVGVGPPNSGPALKTALDVTACSGSFEVSPVGYQVPLR